jgi:hypothetical protein
MTRFLVGGVVAGLLLTLSGTTAPAPAASLPTAPALRTVLHAHCLGPSAATAVTSSARTARRVLTVQREYGDGPVTVPAY